MLTTMTKPIVKAESEEWNATDELIFSSEKKITLRCGKSSITLYPNGKITLKGEYILSDAEGINRLSGGRVDIN